MASPTSSPPDRLPVPAPTPEHTLSAATQVLLGPSPAMSALWSRLQRIAPYFRTVLLSGEAGSGQEAVARALHELSPMRTRPFAVLTAAEAESRLIQENGVQIAGACGTLYLPEPERLSRPAQTGLLRLLQQRGSPPPRVVTFAPQGARSLIASCIFSSDLAHGLGALEIEVPPLRRRSEDMRLLVAHLLRQRAERLGVPIPTLADDFVPCATALPWLGNLDQLEAVLGWLLQHGGHLLRGEDLSTASAAVSQTATSSQTGARMVPLDQVIREQVYAVLSACNGNKLRAAEILGISRSTLYRMLGGSCGWSFPASQAERCTESERRSAQEKQHSQA